MADTIPVFGSYTPAGSSGYNGGPSIFKYTNAADNAAVYLHCGFVPSKVEIYDLTTPDYVLWVAGMTDTYSFEVDTTAYNTSGGVTPIDNGLVPDGSFYIKDGAAAESDGLADDYITGVLLAEGADGAGVDSAAMLVVCWP